VDLLEIPNIAKITCWDPRNRTTFRAAPLEQIVDEFPHLDRLQESHGAKSTAFCAEKVESSRRRQPAPPWALEAATQSRLQRFYSRRDRQQRRPDGFSILQS